ncbi:hypothetical protein ACLMJK_006990 [Lecanora helva]
MTSNLNQHSLLRNGLIQHAGKKRRTSDELPPDISNYVPLLPSRPNTGYTPRSDSLYWRDVGARLATRLLQLTIYLLRLLMSWRPRDLLYLPLTLIIVWCVTLWWGEEATFSRKVADCTWDRWENWPPTSSPHRVVLVADPQLVDPHTYPGRPWPLSTLTIWYTDLYIRKSFQQIQEKLSPDSVFFLGDLFDGGREWSTTSGNNDERESPGKRWRKYDTRYWLKEYRRFNRIFFDPWLRRRGQEGKQQPGRKLIAGLPGNHDLGLGGGIRIPVRKRFQAYFGNGNRFDIVGNHSFVSLDTVSLSAKGQPIEIGGRQGITDQVHSQEVWSPVDQFLHTAKTQKARAIERELRVRNGGQENEPLEHAAIELDDPRAHTIPFEAHKGTDIPSVLLTHVPLYRVEGTPCGPLRERFPQSKSATGELLEKDDGNSIRVQQGVQYQNVLTPEISNQIIDLVGDITHVFSGDDHDYCDVIHRGYTSKNGGIREVTVKSISWAMGVRKPGIVQLSLWNPVNAEGMAIGQGSESTMQTHLCLLPDQLSIFIRYGWLLVLTLFMLMGRAIKTGYTAKTKPRQANGHILPLTKTSAPDTTLDEMTSASALSPPSKNHLAVRSSAGRPRSISPSNGYGYGLPAEETSATRRGERAETSQNGSLVSHEWKDVTLDEPPQRKSDGLFRAIYEDFRLSFVQVAAVVLLWYAWLLLNS